MKNFAKKALSLLLVFVLAVSGAVSALAYDANTGDIAGFYANIDALGFRPKLKWLNLVLDSRFTAVDEEAFAFTLKDSSGETVADETMGYIETFTSAENGGQGFGVFFYFDSGSVPVLDEDETYTMTVPAGVFSTDSSETSVQLTVSFAAAEFIEKRDGFWGFLDMVYNTPVLRVLFAPLIAIIEVIYYISVFFAMR